MRERMRWDSVHSPTSLVDMVHAGWVQRLLRAEDWRGFPGPGDDRTGGQTRIEPQAKRIFEKLADLDISYVHEPANSIPGAQDVRPVDEVLSLRQATCLDMCVTYCCAALDAGIYPLILTLTRTSRKKELRHAIVLVPLERSWSTNCDVVIETGFSREPLIVDEDDFKNVVVDSPDDPSGTWLAIDVQQVSAPPGGATGKWNTALSKGADYVRNWEWDLCVDIGGLRSRRADDADLPTVMGVEGVLAPAYIPLPSNYTFLQLIRARYGVVSFHDRHELRNLRRWAMTPTVVVSEENASKNNAGAGRRPDVAVAVVTGVGGSGKTRLAAQLCHDLSSIGWYTGFLPTTTDITVGELSVLAELTTELLVVVDYAEEARRGQLATVFRALRDRRSPTRIVLTARGTDVWWDEFREELEQDGIDLSNALIISRLGEDRFQNDPVLFDRIYRKAVRSFAERMNHPSPRNIVVPDNLGATALDVVLRAWLAVYDESANSVKKLLTRDDLYDKVLTIEFTQWRKAPALAEVSRVHMGRAAATLSLLAPSQDEDEVDEVLSRLPEWASEHLRRSRFAELLVHTFLRVDGENSVILRPDPVAEYLILKIFGKKPGLLSQVLPVNLLEVSDFEDEDSDTDEITVQQHVRYRQAQNACMTITRAASLDPKKAYRLAKRTLRLRSHMWSNALDVAITQGGPFAPVLEEFIASGADLPLAEIEDAIPLGHGALRSAALALTRRLIDSTEQSPEQRALWVNTLAIRLSEAGEREEALKTAREATGLYRDLAQMSPTTHNPDLAGSLNNLATFLSEVGERDEALEVAREAVQMRRDLVDKSPETYKPDLAMSLNNLAAFLSEVGEREEALKTAREATGLYRDLVEKSPATYKPGLAMSLTTLANHLSEAGERDEALEVAREAVHLRRDLVKVSPAAYTPDLAMSLSNLANRLLEVGERDEALEVAREAVHLRRDLVKVSPVHTQNLAGSLNNLANCLLEAGERDEALEVAREATDMYRDLVEKSPASYTSGLAMSLTTLANCLLEVGERDEALKAAREAVRLRQDSVQVSPTVYTPNLAESLITLANCLLEAGERDEALEIARKATELYRGLAKESPALYTPDLAVSLTTLANRLSEVGERDEALEVAREATDMYRDLVEESSASYTPGLAMSLTTLANRLSEVGERDEALIVIRESTDLFRGLVEVSPATYTPDLAGSLNNLAAFLSEVGEQEEALNTAREAVSLRQDLVQVSPVTYTPDLAGSLNNLAIRLLKVGEREEALKTARKATELYRGLVEVSPATYTPDLAGSLSNLANCLAEVGRQDEALQVFIKGSDRFSPATRAHFLLTRAFWCNDNQEDDLVAAAREADDVDTPALLGPTRRVIVQAIADSGQNLEGLPSWATVEIGAEMRERLEKWINCDDDSERANILEEIWNSPSSSECSALSAVAELYVDVPPIGDLAGLVNRIAEEGVENVVLCIRRRHYAQVIVDDWYSAHANGQGCRSLCKHMVSRSSGENKDYPEWKRELDDPRMRVEVLQLLEMSFSEETANELRSILELADLSDPESAYEVHDSVEEAENALEDLLRVGNWRAMIAALRVRSDLGGLRYGSIAAVLGAAASDDLDRTCKLLDSMHQEIDEVDRQLVESLLKKALLAGDCPEGFEYLHEWFR